MKENKENVKIYKFDVIDSTNDYLRRDHNNHEEFDVILQRFKHTVKLVETMIGFHLKEWLHLVSF